MVWDYLRFDFGAQLLPRPAGDRPDLEKMPVSISLGLWTTLLIYLISIPLGIRKAVKDGTPLRRLDQRGRLVGYAIPGFLFASCWSSCSPAAAIFSGSRCAA